MQPDKTKKLQTVAMFSIIAFAILYLIVNLSVVASFFNGILSVIAPILIGAAIAYLLNPILKLYEYKILRKLKSKSARRTLSIVLTYLTALAFISAFLWLIIPQVINSVVDLVDKFDIYVSKTTSFINSIIHKISGDDGKISQIDEATLMDSVAKFFSASDSILNTVLQYVKVFGAGLFVGVKNTLIGIFISIYVLISKESLHAQARRIIAALFGEKSRDHVHRYLRIANRTFGSYFVGMIFDAILIAMISFVTFSIFRIPYALLVSVIIGVTNIIPIFGPFIGAIPSAFIIFVNQPIKALIFIILIIIIQQIDGNILAPKILGNSIGVSSLGVIVAIIIMGAYFGILGMIIGVPVFAVILTLCNEIIESKLKKKGLATDTAEYYPAYSLVDPNDRHDRPGSWVFRFVEGIIKKIFKLLSKILKKSKNKPSNTKKAKTNQSENKNKNKNDNGDKK